MRVLRRQMKTNKRLRRMAKRRRNQKPRKAKRREIRKERKRKVMKNTKVVMVMETRSKSKNYQERSMNS
jgi:hypothetical protein